MLRYTTTEWYVYKKRVYKHVINKTTKHCRQNREATFTRMLIYTNYFTTAQHYTIRFIIRVINPNDTSSTDIQAPKGRRVCLVHLYTNEQKRIAGMLGPMKSFDRSTHRPHFFFRTQVKAPTTSSDPRYCCADQSSYVVQSCHGFVCRNPTGDTCMRQHEDYVAPCINVQSQSRRPPISLND